MLTQKLACKQVQTLLPLHHIYASVIMYNITSIVFCISLCLIIFGLSIINGIPKAINHSKMLDLIRRSHFNQKNKNELIKISYIIEQSIVRIGKYIMLLGIATCIILIGSVLAVQCGFQILFYLFIILQITLSFTFIIFIQEFLKYNFNKIAIYYGELILHKFSIIDCHFCYQIYDYYETANFTLSEVIMLYMTSKKCCGINNYDDLIKNTNYTTSPIPCCIYNFNISMNFESTDIVYLKKYIYNKTCTNDGIFPNCINTIKEILSDNNIFNYTRLIRIILIFTALLFSILPTLNIIETIAFFKD